MTGKTHATFAIALMPAVAAVSPQIQNQIAQTDLSFFGGMLLGSIFPDFDTPRSTVARRLHIYVPGIEHRGVSHTIYLALILSAIFYFLVKISPKYISFMDPVMVLMFIHGVYGFFVGYMTHLFMDMLTPMGVPILYPFKKKRYHIARIHTGSGWEYLILILMWVFIIFVEGPYFHCIFTNPHPMCTNFFRL